MREMFKLEKKEKLKNARKTDAKRQQKPKNSFTKPLKKPRRVAKSNIKRKVKSNMLTSSFWC